MATYRQLETSREIRLWLGQVIVPCVIGVIMMDEDRRDAVKMKFTKMKDKGIEFVGSVIGSFHS